MRQGQKVENITVEVPCFLKKLREFGSLWIRSFAATVRYGLRLGILPFI